MTGRPTENRRVTTRFRTIVSDAAELDTLIGLPSELVVKKQLSELDDHMRAFVARSPLLLLGTVGKDGRCDVSPRGDRPSAALVLDSRTVVVAERTGNRRIDSLRNIIETGRAGLLLLVPGVGETLRINGRAFVMRDDEILDSLAVNGRKPVVGIGIEVEECYFQCAKALIRSRLWDNPAEEQDSVAFDFARVLVDETRIEGQSVELLKEQIERSYRERLY